MRFKLGSRAIQVRILPSLRHCSTDAFTSSERSWDWSQARDHGTARRGRSHACRCPTQDCQKVGHRCLHKTTNGRPDRAALSRGSTTSWPRGVKVGGSARPWPLYSPPPHHARGRARTRWRRPSPPPACGPPRLARKKPALRHSASGTAKEKGKGGGGDGDAAAMSAPLPRRGARCQRRCGRHTPPTASTGAFSPPPSPHPISPPRWGCQPPPRTAGAAGTAVAAGAARA